MNRSILFFLLLFAGAGLSAQTTVRGVVLDAENNRPIARAAVNIRGKQATVVLTNAQGSYEVPPLPEGLYTLTVTADGYEASQFGWQNTLPPKELPVVHLNSLGATIREAAAQAADFYVEDLSAEAGDEGRQISPLLTASRDPYTNTAGYTFSPMRFRVRGYDSPYQDQYLNGLQVNDMNTGYSAWSLWGGLNDAVRNQQTTQTLEPADFALGNIGGAVNIETRASGFRAGHRLSGSVSNRTYTTRLMYTYATGLMKNGWAVALSGSRRWGSGEYSYQHGQSYDAWGYFLSIEKRFARHHAIALTALAAPTLRGVASGTTEEVYRLAGSKYYNPNIGRQGGIWRNARMRNNHEPIITLSHYWQISDAVKLTTNAGVRFGFNAYSALDWGDAADPRPDYYRYLPSYYTYMAQGNTDQATADYYENLWASRQDVRFINWAALYNANQMNYQELYDAQGRLIARGRQSEYIVADRRNDQRQWSASTILNAALSNHFRLDAGGSYRHNRTASFNVVNDLLGGDFWYDVDKFAERDFGDPVAAQPDLRYPNHIARRGDRIGHDYSAFLQTFDAWAVLSSSFSHIEAYFGLSGGMTLMYRYGNRQHGLFPSNSLGKSEELHFLDYGSKAGLTYKINGNHYLIANAAVKQQAPYFRNIFISPRTRNSQVPDPESEFIYSGDLSYAVRLPWLRGRVSGYYTRINNGIRNMSFYDDGYRTFSNLVLTGIDLQHAGVEVGMEAKLSPTLTANGVFTYGHYSYVSNPDYVQTVDNSEKLLERGQIYWKGFNTAGGPQTAAAVGLTYYTPWYWIFGANVNYYGRSFIDMNPLRRTDKARGQLDPDFVKREAFSDGITMDVYASVSYRLMSDVYLRINLSVSNLLNNQTLKSGGFEQLRVRYNKDGQMVRPFDSKYFYAYGTNFFLNASLQF